MGIARRIRAVVRDERGATIVEYTAVSGLALLLAGLIIMALVANRFSIGGVMAQVLDGLIASFEGGQAGTVYTVAAVAQRAQLRRSATSEMQ